MRVDSILRRHEDRRRGCIAVHGNDIIAIIILVNKDYNDEKHDRQKWPTNGCTDRSTAFLGRKMADGRPLYCTLIWHTDHVTQQHIELNMY